MFMYNIEGNYVRWAGLYHSVSQFRSNFEVDKIKWL